MELILGRELESNENVHHVDEDHTNDHPSNLELKSTAKHAKHHSDHLVLSSKGRLTKKKQERIRTLFKSMSRQELADKFDVHKSTINHVLARDLPTYF
jgi:hypothetical protein